MFYYSDGSRTILAKCCFCLAVLQIFLVGTALGDVLSTNDMDNYIICANRLNELIDGSSFSGYSVIQIPPGSPDTTEVKSELTIIQLHELTEDQVLSMTAMISFRWNDRRLTLNDSDCWNSTAQFTVLNTRSLFWYPQWTISNGHGTVLFEEAWQFNPAIVFANGDAIWKVTFDFFMECPLNVQLFPFDVQQCSIDLTSPHYDTKTLKYKAEEKAIKAETAESIQSPLWRIIGQRTTEVTKQYPSISFRFLIQRRPGFYSVSLILPNVVVNIIMTYTFLLPAWQEEKTSTAGTAVVCYFFIELLFFELCPTSSDNIPGLIIFFTIHTFLAVGAYVVECRLIRFYEDQEEEDKEKEIKKKLAVLMSKLPDAKKNKVGPLPGSTQEPRKKKGPFDGMSPEYINDWCLIGYIVAVVLSYIIVFIYLPVKALSVQNNHLSTGYTAVEVEAAH